MGNYAKKIGEGAITGTILKSISIIGAIITTPLLLRELGTGDYGLYVVVLSLVGLVGISNFGINAAVSNKISFLFAEDKKEEINKLLSGTIMLFGFLSALLFVVILGVFEFLPITSLSYIFNVSVERLSTVYVVSLIVLVTTIFNIFIVGTIGSFYYGINKIAKYNFINSVYNLFYLVSFILFLVFFDVGIVGVVMFQFVTNIVKIVLLRTYIQRFAAWFYFTFGFKHIRKVLSLLNFSFQYFIASLPETFWSKIDVVVTSHFLGNTSVSLYSLTEKLVKFPAELFHISSYGQPSVAILYKQKNFLVLKEMFRRILRIHFVIEFVIISIMGVFFKEIMNIWIGPDFFVSYTFVFIFCAIYLYYAWGGVFVVFLKGMFLQKHLIIPGIVSVLLNVLLSILFVRHWGLVGVAFATLVSHPIGFGLTLPFVLKRYIDIRPFHETANLILKLFPPFALLVLLYLPCRFFFSGNMFVLIPSMLMLAFLYSCLIFVYVLEKKEKDYFIDKFQFLFGKLKTA